MRILTFFMFALLFACPAFADGKVSLDSYDGRNLFVYLPSTMPAPTTRALVVVLHGGMGNASRIENNQSEHALNMDAVAEKKGFVVAYLNGTRAARLFSADKQAWNAGGGCCGLPFKNKIDDVAYIKGVVDHLIKTYGIDRNRVYGIGHSNGAMMTQRVMCETGIFAAAVAVSGPLNTDTEQCIGIKGKKILALHGSDDENVPIDGGYGLKGISQAKYNSEEHSKKVFEASGATYQLDIVRGAEHNINDIDAKLRKTENLSVGEKAVRFFGLLK